MQASPLLEFRRALAQLQKNLSEGQWQDAADAGETLVQAVAACQKTGVVLSQDALADAKQLFERCVTLTAAWGERLNKEAKAAANTSRALQSYGG